jgi:hypothetical protein
VIAQVIVILEGEARLAVVFLGARRELLNFSRPSLPANSINAAWRALRSRGNPCRISTIMGSPPLP